MRVGSGTKEGIRKGEQNQDCHARSCKVMMWTGIRKQECGRAWVNYVGKSWGSVNVGASVVKLPTEGEGDCVR